MTQGIRYAIHLKSRTTLKSERENPTRGRVTSQAGTSQSYMVKTPLGEVRQQLNPVPEARGEESTTAVPQATPPPTTEETSQSITPPMAEPTPRRITRSRDGTGTVCQISLLGLMRGGVE